MASVVYAQNDELFSRLHGLQNGKDAFYNVDGMEITTHKADAEFLPKSIAKNYKPLKIKAEELNTSDTALQFPNYYLAKTVPRTEGLKTITAYYFFETPSKKTVAVTFSAINRSDKEFERMFVQLVRNNEIPSTVFSPFRPDSLNFAGRKIYLGGGCRWMGINNLQCPHYGQMDWSVHKTREGAEKAIEHHFAIVSDLNKGKIVSDNMVPVVFEGTETKARQIIYDFTGVTSALVAMSGGKTLTIYFVAAAVRGNYVSCTMSFWNNDQINDSGLAPLLEEVMRLK
ncbi:MAG: hypothetical protein QM762_01810 [Chryseolinea sp.]